jgi:hypothetical protein
MEVKTDVSQVLTFDKGQILDYGKAEFYNGYLQRVTFRFKGQETGFDLRGISVDSLKELRSFIDQVVNFAEGNQKSVGEQIAEHKDKLLRRVIVTENKGDH